MFYQNHSLEFHIEYSGYLTGFGPILCYIGLGLGKHLD